MRARGRKVERRRHAVERKNIFALVRRARYQEALIRARRYHVAHPDDLHGTYRYAALLGDSQEGLPASAAERRRLMAVGLLFPLMRRLSVFEKAVRFGIRNEYCWFSRRRLAQYRLGVQYEAAGFWRGAYSQGVGAAWHARDLAERGQRRRAKRWARISVKAWGRFNARDSYLEARQQVPVAPQDLGQDRVDVLGDGLAHAFLGD